MKRLILYLATMGVLFGLTSGCVSAIGKEGKIISSLGVSPSSQEVELQPGETYQGSINIYNPSDATEDLDFAISVAPYSVINERYDADFEQESDNTMIIDWITLSETSGTLAPGESQKILYFIDVPEDVHVGGQYAAFIVREVDQSADKNTKSSVSVRATTQIASLLYASVGGKTYSEGVILKNNIPSVVFNSALTASALLQNTGNVHLSSEYVLKVFPLFSDEPVYTTEESPKTTVILPNTRLYTENFWNESPALGIYRVRQFITFGDKTSSEEKIVFLCPTWFFLSVIIFCAVCIGWIICRIYIRRHNAKGMKSGANFQIN